MRKSFVLSALAGAVLLGAGGLAQAKLAGDPVAGEKIYNQQCVSCHGAEVFTRPDRRAKNQQDILIFAQQNCNRALKQPLGMKDLENVATYINNRYYKYAK